MSKSIPRLRRTPCASYRFQLQSGFGFADAAAAVPYLASLGITECYLSPIWKARAGSRHGYDVCDPNALNPELGTAEDFQALVAALHQHDLGLILDIVPNHMAADESTNPWWRDVLRQGQRSPHAHLFDINWYPLKTELHGKVLLPILGTSYGEALESGQLRAGIVDGEPVVTYAERHIPLDVVDASDIEGLNGVAGDEASFDRLHALLERQAYRLSSWRTSAWELNYRRFFNIDHLIGMRVEAADVFHITHQLLASLVASGTVTGLRIDHPDGLSDPQTYFERLQTLGQASSDQGDDESNKDGIYVVVEKVLVPGEQLDPAWQVHGTTGYEFLNALNGVFIARERTRALARVYARFAGRTPDFADTAYAAKKQVMELTFPADLDRLAHTLNILSERDRRTRDITVHALRRALVEFVACLHVYRTYVTERGCPDIDRQRIADAAAEADRRTPSIDSTAFVFLRDVMAGAPNADPERLRVAMRIQQFTGAVFAKAVEDTAFYRDNTLVSLNEVGGDPAQQGVPVEALHKLNRHRQTRTPLAMSATGTHDTKLGEDARARLNVLTERARDWQVRIGLWARANRSRRSRVSAGWSPDRHDEYRFYQALVAIWPVGPSDPRECVADADLVDRLTRYAIKSAREANRHTSWVRENPDYEEGLSRFVGEVLTNEQGRPFLESLIGFAAELALAGAVNGLSQLLLKIASPGVPDFYQGTELWDLHLVDPDNRGLVDLKTRQAMLAVIDVELARGEAARAALAAALLARWTDGAVKLFVTAEALRFRRRHATLFVDGEYLGLAVETAGITTDAVAFARERHGERVIAIAPRLAGRVAADGRWPIGALWDTASVALPDRFGDAAWRNVFTGEVSRVTPDGRLLLADALATFPVALLEPVGR